MRIPNTRLALAAVAAALVAAPAAAEPRLVSATPAAGSRVASPAAIELRLSEKLVASGSGAALVMTGMPGMASHAPMKMSAATSIAKDGSTIVLKPAKKLPTGSYRVDWYAVSGTAPRATGMHEFTVK